jgi:hypothetical protein
VISIHEAPNQSSSRAQSPEQGYKVGVGVHVSPRCENFLFGMCYQSVLRRYETGCGLLVYSSSLIIYHIWKVLKSHAVCLGVRHHLGLEEIFLLLSVSSLGPQRWVVGEKIPKSQNLCHHKL